MVMVTDDNCERHQPFLNPNAPVDLHRRRLPHWQQEDVYYFVTWHMGDALPLVKREALREERRNWIAAHPRPWDPETESAYSDLFTCNVEKWLDAGHGSCLLRESEYAELVGEALLHFDDVRYGMDCFIVMPNHVHTLFHLIEPWRLEQVVKSWKGYSAREINRRRGATGAFWQQEYWDRIVRNARDHQKYRCYIEQNPSDAGLKKGEYLYYAKEHIS